MRNNKGFTLIEIMVVIGIIIVLAGLLMPAFSRARKQATRVECINNLKNIGISIQGYALDNGGNYPATLDILYTDGYLSTNAVLQTPADHSDYIATNLSSWTISTAGSENAVVWSGEVHAGPNKYNVLYGDGHVSSVNTSP